MKFVAYLLPNVGSMLCSKSVSAGLAIWVKTLCNKLECNYILTVINSVFTAEEILSSLSHNYKKELFVVNHANDI